MYIYAISISKTSQTYCANFGKSSIVVLILWMALGLIMSEVTGPKEFLWTILCEEKTWPEIVNDSMCRWDERNFKNETWHKVRTYLNMSILNCQIIHMTLKFNKCVKMLFFQASNAVVSITHYIWTSRNELLWTKYNVTTGYVCSVSRTHYRFHEPFRLCLS